MRTECPSLGRNDGRIAVGSAPNLDEVGRLVQTEPRIPAYWNYLPYLFCVKTKMSAKEFAELFADAAVSGFLVARSIRRT
jgi:hypothetical protein